MQKLKNNEPRPKFTGSYKKASSCNYDRINIQLRYVQWSLYLKTQREEFYKAKFLSPAKNQQSPDQTLR